MMPILTFNYDLWPPKSIEFIASPWLTCLPSSMKKHIWFSQKYVHKLISIHVNCDLWPLTSKIKRVHPLTMANMYAKFGEKANNGLVSFLFTSLFLYLSIVTLTFDVWPPKSIGSIFPLLLTCMPILIRSTQPFSLYLVHKLISMYVDCDLDLRPPK